MRRKKQAIAQPPVLERNDVHVELIAVPEVPEQESIVAVLSTLGQQQKSLINKLASVKNLKQSLMQDLLTGKVRVTVN